MDPTIAYREMLEFEREENLESARELAIALQGWLQNGGFYPNGVTQEDVEVDIMAILESSAHSMRHIINE